MQFWLLAVFPTHPKWLLPSIARKFELMENLSFVYEGKLFGGLDPLTVIHTTAARVRTCGSTPPKVPGRGRSRPDMQTEPCERSTFSPTPSFELKERFTF
jgi:hypothetical protein